jgi:hypothetical protein
VSVSLTKQLLFAASNRFSEGTTSCQHNARLRQVRPLCKPVSFLSLFEFCATVLTDCALTTCCDDAKHAILCPLSARRVSVFFGNTAMVVATFAAGFAGKLYTDCAASADGCNRRDT